MLCLPAVKQVVCPTTAPWNVVAGDFDCDGFPSVLKDSGRASEAFIGTDPDVACAPGNPNVWPVDLNGDTKATTQDVLKYIGKLNTIAPGPPYDVRFDLNGDGKITTQDVLLFIPFLNKKCA